MILKTYLTESVQPVSAKDVEKQLKVAIVEAKKIQKDIEKLNSMVTKLDKPLQEKGFKVGNVLSNQKVRQGMVDFISSLEYLSTHI